MPHLRVRGVSDEVVQKFSEGLNERLAQLLQTSADNFTVEAVSSRFFEDGRPVKGYPFIEVHLFARDQEMKDKAARHMTEKMRALTGTIDVAVVFYPLAKHDYFENGSHF